MWVWAPGKGTSSEAKPKAAPRGPVLGQRSRTRLALVLSFLLEASSSAPRDAAVLGAHLPRTCIYILFLPVLLMRPAASPGLGACLPHPSRPYAREVLGSKNQNPEREELLPDPRAPLAVLDVSC